jgi:hypothetical protein
MRIGITLVMVLGVAMGVGLAGGCDQSSGGGGGGAGLNPQGPTSVLGKARQSARDVGARVSQGGDSKEAVLQSAQGRIEQAEAELASLKGMGIGAGTDAAREVAKAETHLASAKRRLAGFEQVGQEKEASERDALRRDLSAAEKAIAEARRFLQGG